MRALCNAAGAVNGTDDDVECASFRVWHIQRRPPGAILNRSIGILAVIHADFYGCHANAIANRAVEAQDTISTWRLELPKQFQAFDYNTISDVVLHVRYTARDGGTSPKQQAVAELEAAVNTITAAGNEAGQARLFSLRHEFPTEWHRFLTTAETNGDHAQSFTLSKDRFPYLVQGRTITINRVDFYGVPKLDEPVTTLPMLTAPDQGVVEMQDGAPVGQLLHKTANSLSVEVASDKAGATWNFKMLSGNAQSFFGVVKDILVVCIYTVS